MKIYSEGRQGYTNKQGWHAQELEKLPEKIENMINNQGSRVGLEDVYQNLMCHVGGYIDVFPSAIF